MRPGICHVETIPHPMRQTFEVERTARRTTDPLLGIRAVFIHTDAWRDDGLPACHHLVPAPQMAGHGKHAISLANEVRSVHSFAADASTPLIANGLTDPSNWSVSIAMPPAVGFDGARHWSPWQIDTCARLVRQCWRRYPSLHLVALAHVVDQDVCAWEAHGFDAWSRLVAAILDARLGSVEPTIIATLKNLDEQR